MPSAASDSAPAAVAIGGGAGRRRRLTSPAMVRSPMSGARTGALLTPRLHRGSPGGSQLVEAQTGLRMDRLLGVEPIPALDRDVDIARVQLERTAHPAGLLGRNDGRSAAGKASSTM
jgi:hypothetical protein